MSHSAGSELIRDVSDTAIWVAQYRADESRRPDALFKDELAQRLTGERGRLIADRMFGSQYTRWSVVMRTCMIDRFIRERVAQGVDLVINLGAGLDTRPYRMDLPASLRWIEVDQANLIQLKNQQLAAERPRCQLARVTLDLSDRATRTQWLREAVAGAQKVFVLTEGVVPYLSNEQAAELAEDLHTLPQVRHWLVDYFSPEIIRYIQRGRRGKMMRNAPFRFFPPDWTAFYAQRGWRVEAIRYHAEEAEATGRQPPRPLLLRIAMLIFRSAAARARFRQALGYAVLEPF